MTVLLTKQSEDMLVAIKGRFDPVAFDAFMDLVRSKPDLVNAINTVTGNGVVKSIQAGPASWDSGTGTIKLMLAGPNDLALYHLAHEINHALYDSLNTPRTQMLMQNGYDTISSSSSSVVNLTTNIKDVVDHRLREEARALMHAYNDLATAGPVDGMVVGSNGVSQLITGLRNGQLPETSNGLFDVTDAALDTALDLLRSSGWNSYYVGTTLGRLCNAAGDKVIDIDLGTLFPSGMQLSRLAQATQVQYGLTDDCTIRQLGTNETITIPPRSKGVQQSFLSSPDGAVASVLTWFDDDLASGPSPFAQPVSALLSSTGNLLGFEVPGMSAGTLSMDPSAFGGAEDYAYSLVRTTMQEMERGGAVSTRVELVYASDGQPLLLLQGSNGLVAFFTYDVVSGRYIVESVGFADPVTGMAVREVDGVLEGASARSDSTNGIYWRGIDWDAAAVSAASALGSTFGRRLFGDDHVAGAFAGSALGELTSQLAAELAVGLGSDSRTVQEIAARQLHELGVDIAGAGVGAFTSYLVGEVFSELGINGFAGEALQSAVSFTLATIASNLVSNVAWDNGLGSVNFANMAGSFVGSKLASYVHEFDTVGGQIGFSVGGSVGAGIAIGAFQLGTNIIANFLAPGVGAFVGALIGGAIGDLIVGTPESGVQVVWNAAQERFVLGGSWTDDWAGSGGSEAALDRAKNMALTATDVLNRVVTALIDGGAEYQNPHAVNQGAYGQRNQDWIYWYGGENSTYTPFDDPVDALNRGLHVGLNSLSMQGGDIYLKRALYRTLEAHNSDDDLNFSQLLGDLSIAADLSFYQGMRTLIDATLKFAPESALAQGWVLTKLRASEVGIDQFYKSDFYGGLGGFLDGSNHVFGEHFVPAEVTLARGSHGDIVLGDASALSGTLAQPAAWSTSFASESRWAAVAGPDGRTVTAMRTGQFASDPDAAGGGGLTNSFAVNPNQTYEFTIYVRKADLTRHDLIFDGTGFSAVNAVNGAAVSNARFLHMTPAEQAALESDRWYMVVGTVLGQGKTATSHSQHGGIYDMVTGERVGNTATYAWDPGTAPTTASLRFFNYGNETSHGYSTYWLQPEVRMLNRPEVSLVDLQDWELPPPGTMVLPGFANTFGYAGGGIATGHYVGSLHSDIMFAAAGTASINLHDLATAAGEAPGIVGKSRLSDDIFVGNDGANDLKGYAGWDWLDGGAGADTINGGAGNDVLIGRDARDIMHGGSENDRIDGGTGNDELDGGDGDDTLYFGQGVDIYDGALGSDTLSFEGITTLMEGNYGAVFYFNSAAAQPDTISDDSYVSIENATGSRFADYLVGNGGGNVLSGMSGEDELFGGEGNDLLIGGQGKDVLQGQGGVDTASYRTSLSGVDVSLAAGAISSGGDAEGDILAGIANLEGSEHADTLRGGAGTSTLWGLDGNDVLRATSGTTIYRGGEGIDTVDYFDASSGVIVNLETGEGTRSWSLGDRYYEVEQVMGSAFADKLIGSAADERFHGGAGEDTLVGGAGNDSYAFTRGGGYDHIIEGGGDFDYLVIDDAVNLNALMLRRSGSTLMVGSGSDTTYVNSHFIGGDVNFLDSIYFENGSKFRLDRVTTFVNGTLGNDVLSGSLEGSYIHGRTGDDKITGSAEDDILIGGSGKDELKGGMWNDRYVFGRGSGIDEISDSHGTDTIVVAGDISASDLMISYDGPILYIGVKTDEDDETAATADDRIVINGQKSAGSAIEYIELGGQRYSLPNLVGDATGTNTAPQLTGPASTTKYAIFNAGQVASIQAFDAEGDKLTFTIDRVENDISAQGMQFSFVNTNQLYTSNSWNGSTVSFSIVHYTVSDGLNTTVGNIKVWWKPGSQGPQPETHIAPIVLDLDGNGVTLIEPEDSLVTADINEDGLQDKIGWAGPGDAFLAFDRDADDLVSGLNEISFVGDMPGATTDLEGLRGFDFDHEGVADGKLDASDAMFAEFMIWVDANQNGVSEVEEVRSLAEAGILSIDLAGTPTGQVMDGTGGNRVLNTGAFTRTDGTSGTFGDVALGVVHGAAGAGETGDPDGTLTGAEAAVLLEEGSSEPADESSIETGTVSPVVLDLDFDGINLVTIGRSNVRFDMDGDGDLDVTGWVSQGDGILALDGDADGMISEGSEISFVQYKPGAKTDLEGLLAFDSNDDSRLDLRDARFEEFLVWRDLNGNGVSEASELFSLADIGVKSISLEGEANGYSYGGNTIHQLATFQLVNGDEGAIGDVSLGYLGSDSAPAGEAPVWSPGGAAAALAELRWDIAGDLALPRGGWGLKGPGFPHSAAGSEAHSGRARTAGEETESLFRQLFEHREEAAAAPNDGALPPLAFWVDLLA